jgi:ATP-dependent RNA helicase SUPV3L1/SUV3
MYLVRSRLLSALRAAAQQRRALTSSAPAARPPPPAPLVPSRRQALAALAHLRCEGDALSASQPPPPPRRVIFHAGPTNSGKTHAALAALASARSGAYAGPLRLLAHEVGERLNSAGCRCDVLTGQEQLRVAGARHVAATVEMLGAAAGAGAGAGAGGAPLDVAVLDEVQMIGDQTRGWAWTRALLGLRARELHLCGDPAAEPLVRSLLRRQQARQREWQALRGRAAPAAEPAQDSLEVRPYRRLAPLEVARSAVGSLGELRRGDCLVAFGRAQLFDYKREIERRTGLRVGLLYGALPPAVRREQARRFNGGADEAALRRGGSGGGGGGSARSALGGAPAPPGTPFAPRKATDVLVATDAIGMGLNLSIRRVIFASTSKFDGRSRRRLTVGELKQIGGRAGRGAGVAGVVSSLDARDLPLLQHALSGHTPTPPVARAGLMPSAEQLEQFAAALAPDEWRVRAPDAAEEGLASGAEGEGRGESSPEELGEGEAFGDVFDEDVEGTLFASEDDAANSHRAAVSSAASAMSSSASAHLLAPAALFGYPSGVRRLHTSGCASALGDRASAVLAALPPQPPPLTPPPPDVSPPPEAAALACVHESELADRVVAERLGFSQVLRLFGRSATVEAPFFATDLEGLVRVARLLDDVRPPLPFRARYAFAQAPADPDDALVAAALRRYAARLAEGRPVRVALRLPAGGQRPRTPAELAALESAFAVYDVYIWLARRFPAEFATVAEAEARARDAQRLIGEGLEALGAAQGQRRRDGKSGSRREVRSGGKGRARSG